MTVLPGSSNRSSTGAKSTAAPARRISVASASPKRSASTGSPLAPSANAEGNVAKPRCNKQAGQSPSGVSGCRAAPHCGHWRGITTVWVATGAEGSLTLGAAGAAGWAAGREIGAERDGSFWWRRFLKYRNNPTPTAATDKQKITSKRNIPRIKVPGSASIGSKKVFILRIP